MINEITKDTIDRIINVNGKAEIIPAQGLVSNLIYEDDEVDIEREACRLQCELIDFQRGQGNKEWAQRIVNICNLMNWKIVFEPNCFTGFMEPEFIKAHNNEYVVKEAGCEFYHGHLVD